MSARKYISFLIYGRGAAAAAAATKNYCIVNFRISLFVVVASASAAVVTASTTETASALLHRTQNFNSPKWFHIKSEMCPMFRSPHESTSGLVIMNNSTLVFCRFPYNYHSLPYIHWHSRHPLCRLRVCVLLSCFGAPARALAVRGIRWYSHNVRFHNSHALKIISLCRQ